MAPAARSNTSTAFNTTTTSSRRSGSGRSRLAQLLLLSSLSLCNGSASASAAATNQPQQQQGAFSSSASGQQVSDADRARFSSEGYTFVGAVQADGGSTQQQHARRRAAEKEEADASSTGVRAIRMTSDGLVYMSPAIAQDGQTADSIPPHLPEDARRSAAGTPPSHPQAGRDDRSQGRLAMVLGQDQRSEVADTSGFPHRAVGRLLATRANQEMGLCTGTLIAEDLVLTAAHCVMDETTREWHVNFEFSPGQHPAQDGSAASPFGSFGFQYVEVPEPYTTTTSTSKTAEASDIALIRLKRNAAGETVGSATGAYLGLARSCEPPRVRVVGYPGSKEQYSMWSSAECDVSYTCGEALATYQCDTEGGQSGAPVMDDSGYVYGVHVAADDTAQENLANWFDDGTWAFVARYL